MNNLLRLQPVDLVIAGGGFGAFIPTRSSWNWHKRKHMDELVTKELLVLGKGRRPDLVDPERVEEIVQIVAK